MNREGGTRFGRDKKWGRAPARGRHAPRGPATRACSSVAGKAGSPASIRSCMRSCTRAPAPGCGFAEPGRVTPRFRPLGLECSTGGVLTRPPPASRPARGSRQDCTARWGLKSTLSWSPWFACSCRGGKGEWPQQSSRHGLPPSLGAAKAKHTDNTGARAG